MNNEYLAYGVTNICSTLGRRIVDRVTNICSTFGRRIVDRVTNICSTLGCRIVNIITILGGCRSFRKRKDAPPTESSSYLAKLERLLRTNVPTTIFLAKKITLKQA